MDKIGGDVKLLQFPSSALEILRTRFKMEVARRRIGGKSSEEPHVTAQPCAGRCNPKQLHLITYTHSITTTTSAPIHTPLIHLPILLLHHTWTFAIFSTTTYLKPSLRIHLLVRAATAFAIMPSATGQNWEKYQKNFADDEIEEKKITPLTDE